MSTAKLKIFIIGPAYPLRGGPAKFNENLAEELQKAGHDASIISYKLLYPNFLFPGSSQFETGGIAPENIKINTLIHTLNPFNWIKVARFIRKEKPDFILFRYWIPFLAPSLGSIARLVRRKTTVIALTDNVLPHEKRAGDRMLTGYFVRSCHGFITMSHKVLEDLAGFAAASQREFSPHPMYETYGDPIGKKEAREKLGLNSGDKIVLFFGLVRHYKGLDILLEAMQNHSLKHAGVKLLIAGEFYEKKEKYAEWLNDKELSGRIILHDHFIPNELIPHYFCASDLVAQTYRDATNSGVTMVAYFYGRPMLVTNVGGLKEIVPNGRCGYVVEPDATAIAARIADYFEKENEQEFSKNVAEEREKYRWSGFIQTLLKLYDSIGSRR